jgi:hypothetical protein
MRDVATRSNRMTSAAAGRAAPSLNAKIMMITVTSEAGRTRAS